MRAGRLRAVMSLKAPVTTLPTWPGLEVAGSMTEAGQKRARPEASSESVYLRGTMTDLHVISNLGGRAGITIGVLLTSLMLLSSSDDPARWLVIGAGIFAFTAGAILLRFPRLLSLHVLDFLLVVGDALLRLDVGGLPKYGPLQSGYDHFFGFRGGATVASRTGSAGGSCSRLPTTAGACWASARGR